MPDIETETVVRIYTVAAVVLIATLSATPPPTLAAEEDAAFFAGKVLPVLRRRCFECHSHERKIEGELTLDSKAGWQTGGFSGPALVPGKPEQSLLVKAVGWADQDLQMPPTKKLPEDEIAVLTSWVARGAPDPRQTSSVPGKSKTEQWKAELKERSTWWSLQPPKASAPPQVADATWGAEPVDRFIFAKLRKAGLSPAPPADAETLLRRLSFVLTGLPPSPRQVVAFRRAFAQDADSATARLVDELLASEHFGERFARHWMDVVRYTDTYGYEWDNPAKGSWEYRDYLIRAFNGDVPFDQLIREQLAGDLLAAPRIDANADVNESLIGPMFYHMGEHRHGSSLAFNGIHQEMVNNKIDAFSKAFLGMTVACARCHDHKLDAISQADYYALAGVFMTPRWTARSIDAPGKNDVAVAELKQIRDAVRKQLAEAWQAAIREDALQAATLRHWADSQRAAWKDPKLEDIAYPFAQLLESSAADSAKSNGDEAAAERWRRLADEWRSTADERRKQNKAKFQVLADFAQPGFPENWAVEGDGIQHGYTAEGTPLIALEGDRVVAQLLPRGYHTHALSSKLPGAVRTPAHDAVPGRFVSLKVTGGEWAGKLIVPQNAFQNEGLVFFDPAAPPTWVSVADSTPVNGVTRVTAEFATSALNPNFPPRTGVARSGGVALPDADDGFDKRSWFSLTGIVAHDAAGAPADTLDAFTGLYDGPAPTTVDAAWRRLAAWATAAVDRWAAGKCRPGDITLLNRLLAEKLLPNDIEALPQLAPLVKRYREIESRVSFPRSAMSMDERGVAPVNYRLNLRGDVDQDGPPVPRGFLEVFVDRNEVGKSSGSGRLELAEYLASPRNPQTARVYVNRVWQWVFGTGLAATPDDFGKLGDRPSHPELLDYLALEFMQEGWSTKKLLRRLVLSRTFRQSGAVAAVAAERDPDNRLLHHYPTRRLEAEAIRDSLLVVSGRLDPRLFGRPIKPPRNAEDAKKRLFSGPLDGHGRRSIYIEMSIMEPPKFLKGFNLPDLKLPTGKRDVTNVPAQALILLNDPLVIKMAKQWAERLLEDGRTVPAERLRAMFLTALGREPSAAETSKWTEAVASFAASSGDVMSDRQAWTELAHALFNVKEFIYYR
jgi:hypothetical protein